MDIKLYEVEYEFSEEHLSDFIHAIRDKTNYFAYRFGRMPDCVYINWLQYKKIEVYLRLSDLYRFYPSIIEVIGMEVIPIPIDYDYLEVGFKYKDEMINHKLITMDK